MPETFEKLKWVLLEGYLLCVGFGCLANVPDLLRWLFKYDP